MISAAEGLRGAVINMSRFSEINRCCIIARISLLYSRGWVWAVPTKKAMNTMSYLSCKKIKKDV